MFYTMTSASLWLFFCLITILSINGVAASLYSLLESVEYLNNGTVTSSDIFGWSYRNYVLYGEPENVTTVGQSWAIASANFPILYKSDGTPIPPPSMCTLIQQYPNSDMEASDMGSIVLDHVSVDQCEAFCCRTDNCAAFVVAIAPSPYESCAIGQACCYLKSNVGRIVSSNVTGIAAGIVTNRIPPDPFSIHPPTGIRSGVPAGGISCGSIDLRADGTFHEWTIANQSPGGSAKFGIVGDAVMALSLQQGKGTSPITRFIRTSGPRALPGVDSLTFRGSYPLSRLDVNTSDIPLQTSIYFYSRFRVGDLNTSATPAVILSANIHNPTKTAITASFLFNVPWGMESDYQRNGGSYNQIPMDTPLDCMRRCDGEANCMSWSFTSPICSLNGAVPGGAYLQHSFSGVKGVWSWKANTELGTTNTTAAATAPLIYTRPGAYAASGDISLWPTVNSADGRSVPYTFNYGVGDDLINLYYDWQINEGFTSIPSSGTRSAANGIVAITMTIQPGQNITASIIFSWFFPNRDHVGEIIGNYYQHLFSSATEVGRSLIGKAGEGLIPVISDILALHSTYMSTSLPEYLIDNLINSVSHMRSAIWAADGRWRQWEAYDCVDIDSVHNDYQRHMPYILYFPETEKIKMRAHAGYQQSNGMINEVLSTGCIGGVQKWDAVGGRAMADVTNLFITEIYELYMWTGDVEFLNDMYPHVVKGAQWEVSVSPMGLPERLVSTYDIIGLDAYRFNTFNAVLHLLGMRVTMQLATIMDDPTTYQLAHDSFILGSATLDATLWSSQYQFYRSYYNWDFDRTQPPNVLFADSLYAQVIAYTLGLGDLLPRDQMLAHILAEESYNDSPYGLIVQTGREASNNNQDNAIWMGGSQDWTSLALRFGLPATNDGAYRQAAKGMNNWRYRLNDLWNVWGLVGGRGIGDDGLWWTTSHYGFHMVLWHTPFSVTQQNYSAITQSLTFNPVVPIPYRLPVMIPNVLGTLTASSQTGVITYTLRLNTGSVVLKSLIVGGSLASNSSISLTTGNSYSWKTTIKPTPLSEINTTGMTADIQETINKNNRQSNGQNPQQSKKRKSRHETRTVPH